MIRDFIYFMPIVIFFISAISISLAIINKDRNNNKLIIVFNIVNILYLFNISFLIMILIPVFYEIVIFLVWGISIYGGILYLISTIICICKRKKLNDNSANKLNLKILKIMMLVPIIIFIIILSKELYLIKNSQIILCCEASRGGGLFDSCSFSYAVSDKYCKEISIDVWQCYVRHNRWLLPKKINKTSKKGLQNRGYEVSLGESYISVSKNEILIHEKKLKNAYYKNTIEEIFINE